MHIRHLTIDRFGTLENVSLRGFIPHLNVLYGTSGTGKTTIAAFIDSVFNGFHHPRFSHLAGDGGTLVSETPDGPVEIRRGHDGTPGGRLEIREPGGPALTSHQYSRWFGDLQRSARQGLFHVDFNSQPSIQRLIDLARLYVPLESRPAAPIPADQRQREQTQAALQQNGRRVDRLRERLRSLEDRIRNNRTTAAPVVTDAGHALRGELAKVEQQLARLRHQLADVEREYTDWEQSSEHRATPAAQREGPVTHPDLLDPVDDGREVIDRLNKLDRQYQRWQRVRRDVHQRRSQLRDELTECELNEVTDSDSIADPHQRLRMLESQTRLIRGQLESLDARLLDGACECRDVSRQLTPVVRALQDEIYALCQDLSQQQRQVRRDVSRNELKQLRRCQNEIDEHLKRLAVRRKRLLGQFGELDPAGLELFQLGVADDCQCDDHAGRLEGERCDRPEPRWTTESQQTRDRLVARRAELVAAIQATEQRRDEIRRQADRSEPVHSRFVDSPDAAHEWITERDATRRELAETQMEVERLHRQLMRIDTAAKAVEKTSSSTSPGHSSQVIERASAYLRRLTEGRYSRIAPASEGRTLVVLERAGQAQPSNMLSQPLHDQVYLSLCLGIVGEFGDRGVRLPLILDEPFARLHGGLVRPTAELISEFASEGHQIVLLTGNRDAARVLREERVVAPSTDPPRRHHGGDDRYRIHRESRWSTEEFPGELRDHVRLHERTEGWDEQPAVISRDHVRPIHVKHFDLESLIARPVVAPPRPAAPVQISPRPQPAPAPAFTKPITPPLPYPEPEPEPEPEPWPKSSQRYYLESSSPIEDAPSIGPQVAIQLRSLGICQVSDLLGVSPETAAAQLAEMKVPSRTIRDWQAQAWLVCCVPHLRAYDARILVACGITDPDQLERIDAEELHYRIEQFLTTAQGERMVAAGTPSELERFRSWIRSARQARRRRHRELNPRRRGAGAGLKISYEDPVPNFGSFAARDSRTAKSEPAQESEQERERREARRRAEQRRLRKEWEERLEENYRRARADREARERAEQERRARVQREALEHAERKAREQAERDARARRELEAQQRAEREARIRAEFEDRERARREAEEDARLREEIEARQRAQNERDRSDQARTERDRAERDRAERTRAERTRVERTRAERERVEREQVEPERVEREQVEPEQVERERAERERTERTRAERSREREERRSRRRRERDRDRNGSRRSSRLTTDTSSSESSSRSGRGRNSSRRQHEESTSRFYLETESPVVDAPTIGPRTAEQLAAVGVHAVSDLLNSDPQTLAEQLGNRRIKAEHIKQWQDQAILVCRIPNLRGHDAQLLVACGYTNPDTIGRMNPHELLAVIGPFADTREGERIVRSGRKPDLEEIEGWIASARKTRRLAA